MAARAPQEILTAGQALAFIERHGVVAESAKHPHVPSLAAAIAGSPVRGNWWTHARAKTIFAITRAVRESPDVLVCRIVDGKIGFVHRRLWPALLRAAHRFAAANIASIREVHTAGGNHRVEEIPFVDWVADDVRAASTSMSESDAVAAFKTLLSESR